ncbi:MAG: hypothetical protein Q8R57_09350 [Bacteroidota bacterium]|nr:hypothetical protein [Bacteroidota bacterium]
MSWKITPIQHKGEARLLVAFDNEPFLNKKIRAIDGALWSASLKSWHVPDTPSMRMQFHIFDPTINIQEDDLAEREALMRSSEVPAHIVEALKQFDYYLQSRRYRQNTIKTYKESLLVLLQIVAPK